jgi:hypothetical protein
MRNATKAPKFYKVTAPNWYAYRAKQGSVTLEVVRQEPGKWYAYAYRDGWLDPHGTSAEAFSFRGAIAECHRYFNLF